MPRGASLFELTNGDVVKAYFEIKKNGSNIPPMWIERAKQSRKSREIDLGKKLKANKLDAVTLLNDWNDSYKKECFYRGLRILLELQREGKSNL
jgi:hypothetical protein